jgi:aconitate hydratase
MSTQHNVFNSLREFDRGDSQRGLFYSLPALEEAGIGNISRLPVSIRIILESVFATSTARK